MGVRVVTSVTRELGVACAAAAAALALLELVFPAGAGVSTYATASAAIAIAAAVGGLVAGLLALALIGAAVVHEHLPPFGALHVDRIEDLLGLLIFVANGVVVAVAGALAGHRLPRAPGVVQRSAGHTLISPLRVPLPEVSDRRHPAPYRAPGLVEPLTGREVEVLELLAAGMSNEDIAAALFLSVNTVKTHLKNVYGKLEVTSRTQAAARARTLGVVGAERVRVEGTTEPRAAA